MKPLAQDEIRRAFVNMSKSRSRALSVPVLDRVDWEDRDFYAWTDGRDLSRAYLVAQRPDGPVGVELRATRRTADFRRKSICGLCYTSHPVGGTALFSALKGGREGRLGNSVGLYACRNLACSAYARKKIAAPMGQMDETLDLDERIARVVQGLEAFVSRILH
ncbi:FBP domain-containing protein [Streptomyces sp. 2P-4]|uniref:FBP domain-containing protein n=1 Tax=Streptomyces sp. 2P-4 TaxID=2931974 RepID=UPI00253FF30D|nr:FBP domain-containing protein [Streptomyces sp. 2P-4]